MEKKYIWHRIKRGQTLERIAQRNGIESWKELYDFNKDLLKNPNLLIYVDEKEYDDGWCINNKQGILRIPIVDRLNEQDQEEELLFTPNPTDRFHHFEEGVEEIYKKFCIWEMTRDLSKEQKEMFDDLLSEVSKLKDNK